ncbi:unnamed protein product [Miscanthus lutarioriparius]|uniref:non-specific serine/threonine protein kinase n=2 Tax=Miscanthus lutarioriparius TaxID=422564 RepID=A0A811NZ96_9POAL|nr:unnamed protein product [Miscanthus lutarioriparius]
MPRALMASTEHRASSPAGGPPGPKARAPPPKASSSSPPPSPPKASSSSPPPPTPSPPQHSPPPPPSKQSPPPPAPATPPEKSPTASPPPPASPPPASKSPPPPPSPSTPPPSPPPRSSPPPPASSSTPPSSTSQQSPPGPESAKPPPPSSSEKPAATASPPPNATSSSGSKSEPPPRETPSTPPDTTAGRQPPPAPGTPSSPTQMLPPPMAVTVIMPGASGPPAGGRWRGPPGPAATAPPLSPPAGGRSGSSNMKNEAIIIGISVAGLLLALVSLLIMVCVNSNHGKRKRHSQPSPSRRHNIVVPEPVASLSPDVYQASNGGPPAPSPSGTNSYDLWGSMSWFTYDELVGITGGFSAGNVIGEGGFGKVYIGALGDGRRVAVKQLKVGSGQGEKEFRAEVDIISRIHHRHLVTLVGYCVTENHRLLVYEFVANNTLEHHLHGKGLPVMDWSKRMKIAIGAARGLTYLHEDCHPRIIHRDIKSANILLDDAFEAKVADFGLAKLTNDSLTHISTRVMGTFGYMAPEYAQSGKLTDRSDVFSFGVVLLELITGRKPVDASQPLGEESLVEWARLLLVDALETDDFREVADPALECRFSKTEMRRMVEAAAACVRHSAAKRPRMVQVWRSLDVDECSSDLTNGVKLGQSMAYDSGRYSVDIELFRRMAFANDLSTAELGVLDEDDQHSSKAGSSSRRHK